MKTNDARVLELKEQINKKREKIGRPRRFNPLTTCIIDLGNNFSFNIHVLSRDELMKLAVRLNGMRLSALDLGYDVSTLLYSGFSLDDWLSDVNEKLAIMNQKEEEKSLKLLETRLERMLSEEKKTELELDEISKLLE